MTVFRSRQGNVLVEASLIYPMIIAVTLILLSMAMYFYNMTALISDMERSVRREAGVQSGTVFYGAEIPGAGSEFEMNIQNGLLSGSVSAEKKGRFEEHVVFPVRHEHAIAAEASVLCEVGTLRNRQAVGNVIDTITG